MKRTQANFPRMKVRGGRRRARTREQKLLAYASAYYISIGHTSNSATFLARLAIYQANYWQIPDDPFNPVTWIDEPKDHPLTEGEA